MNEEELNARIAILRHEFGNLLDDDALRKLILDEEGLLITNMKCISNLKDREEVSVEAIVTRIFGIREFKKLDGTSGRVRNIEIEDGTGGARLVLWDEDVELPERIQMKVGTKLRLINCFVKFTDFGIDIMRGKRGRIEIVN
ncbi:MAG: hypothetical protein H5T41_02110 [Methanomassiliicoccales archaeon]|nr:hypothetical protein [Methanomassiliicoccales archaeon]